jgi:hypothetical protein
MTPEHREHEIERLTLKVERLAYEYYADTGRPLVIYRHTLDTWKAAGMNVDHLIYGHFLEPFTDKRADA